jgi:hypothetical protein
MKPYIGQNVFVRSVTHYYTGRLVEVADGFARLEDAAWVADTGRFGAALRDGTLSEIEPYPGECLVSLGAIVDVSPWTHELPRKEK